MGAGAGVGAGTSADVQVFGSVRSTVPCMQEVLEHSTQSFTLIIDHDLQPSIFPGFLRMERWACKRKRVPTAVQERESVHALLSREHSSDSA